MMVEVGKYYNFEFKKFPHKFNHSQDGISNFNLEMEYKIMYTEWCMTLHTPF